MLSIKYSSLFQNKRDLLLKTSFINIHQGPKLSKISVNIGLTQIAQEKKKLLLSFVSLESISNQEPLITKSKKMNPALKIRKGMAMGSKVNLRKKKAYAFLDRLSLMVLPRSSQKRIFSIKSKNNFSFSIKNPIVFLELEQKFPFFNQLKSLDIDLLSTHNEIDENILLFSQYFLPFLNKRIT